MSTNTHFDPRAWNLLAGVALVSTGCGSRVASQEAGDTGETADTYPDSAEDPECVDSSDCPVGYGCYDGVCMYYPHHDGWIPYYDCYSDQECDEFYVCEFGYCSSFGEPPPNCEDAGLAWPPATTIDVGSEALALTFADVDIDGQYELVVATQAQLLAYQHEGGDPIASPRDAGPVTDMVTGIFDDQFGEDVLLLSGDSLLLHLANADGSFGPAMPEVTQLGFVTGLFAGEFDQIWRSEVLAWGGAGAYLDFTGQIFVLDEEQITAAAVHELGAAEPGFALRRDTDLDFYTLDGQLLTTWTDVPGSPSLAAFKREFMSDYAFVNAHHGTWSRVQTRNLDGSLDEWSIPGTPTHIFAGDLDGSGTDELVYVQNGTMANVHFNPRQGGECLQPLPSPGRGSPVEAVFGDHDGDEDLELAIRTDMGDVALFDGG